MSVSDVGKSLIAAAAEFKTACMNDPQKCGVTASEKLWMEELSKIYLAAECNLRVPEHPTDEFTAALNETTKIGNGSALTTRIIFLSYSMIRETDFETNTPNYLSTLEHHQEHWSQKFMECDHVYKEKRSIENFMHAYFDDPQSISEDELAYHLTLYFKHFYRFLYKFMLFYTQSTTIQYYGGSKQRT